MSDLEKQLEKLYLDYVNNFATTVAFAAHHNVHPSVATHLIASGQLIHNGIVAAEY